MPEARPRLYLIDGYSNIFRAFYAIRHLSNSKGEPTNAVYGFVQMLRKLLRDEQPDLIGVALDVSRRTVRTEKFEDYKANRAPMPEELRGQIPQIRKALEAHRIPILEMENYEADDVLGSLAGKAAEEGYDVILRGRGSDLGTFDSSMPPRMRYMDLNRRIEYQNILFSRDVFDVTEHIIKRINDRAKLKKSEKE